MSILYGYVSLGFSNDPEHCYAWDKSYTRITDARLLNNEEVVDVGNRFRTIFNIAFAIGLLYIPIGLLMCSKSQAVRTCCGGLGNLVKCFGSIVIFTGYFFRAFHTGRVCSGDFLEDHDDTSGYVVTQGFILALFICVFLAMIALLVSLGILVLFLHLVR